MSGFRSPFVLPVLVLLAALLPAQQQQTTMVADLADRGEDQLREAVWEVEAIGSSTYIVGSDVEGANEDINVWSNRIDFRFRGPAWRGAFVEFGLDYEHREYDFQGTNDFFPLSDDPWQSVNTIGFQALLLQGFGGGWGAMLYFQGNLSAEYGADPTDGFSSLTMLGVGYQCTDNFRAGLGVVALTRFEEDLLIVPGFYFDWQIDEQWRLALFGPRAVLEFEPDDTWRFALSLGIDGRRFRLSDEGTKNDDIVQEFRVPLAFDVRWRGVEKLDLGLTVGVDLYREYRISDRDGNNDRVFETDPGLFFGFFFEYTF